MKKILLSIFSAALISASAFAQIPNNGFENWTAVGSYSVPNSWGTMNNTTTLSGIYTATVGTPGSPGSSYLKLTSKTIGASVVNGIAVSGRLDSMTMQPISGFPCTLQPVSFTGKWQHMIYGSSQGSISVLLTKWNSTTLQRDVVATANQTLSGMAMSWANFTINFNYVSSTVPDSCIIVLKASGANPTNNDYLWVDNLAFTGSVVGIKTIDNYVSSISVYPNPSTENITVTLNIKQASHVQLQLIDLTGKLIKDINAGEIKGEYKNTINTTGITKGIYFLKVIADDAVDIKKIIVQ